LFLASYCCFEESVVGKNSLYILFHIFKELLGIETSFALELLSLIYIEYFLSLVSFIPLMVFDVSITILCNFLPTQSTFD
jgi:hypothetical protein